MSILYSCITTAAIILVEKSNSGNYSDVIPTTQNYSDVISTFISDTNFNLKKKTTVPNELVQFFMI